MDSVIAEWYAGQHVLITGATGFMGKILVEKILRSCPKVAAVYMLVRPKKGKEPEQRLEEFLNNPVFDKIREELNSAEIFKKLHCISGDVTQKDCGIFEDDRRLLKDNVSIVFNMAANVRFDMTLKNAVLFNCGGTLNVLDLAVGFDKLKAFVHVSTTYCHCDETELKEELYKAPHKPRNILDLVKWMDEDLLETLTPKLLKNSPNTYCYTKSLVEELVSEYSDRLPLVIARPSIVIGCYKEPIPGWIDNINGPTGVLIGVGKGVIRTMLCNSEVDADVIPVDMGINWLLIIAWKVGSQPKRDEVDVYNIACDKEYCKSWGEVLELAQKHVNDYPFSLCLWYPRVNFTTSYLTHYIAQFFFHLIPAYFVDFILILTRNKPFLVKTQKRIRSGLEMLKYFATRAWLFHNDKLKKLDEELNAIDKEVFYTDCKSVNPDEYMRDIILGARKYCVHEDLNTLPRARKNFRRLYYLDQLKNIILALLLLWFFYYFAVKLLDTFEHSLELFGGARVESHQRITTNV